MCTFRIKVSWNYDTTQNYKKVNRSHDAPHFTPTYHHHWSVIHHRSVNTALAYGTFSVRKCGMRLTLVRERYPLIFRVASWRHDRDRVARADSRLAVGGGWRTEPAEEMPVATRSCAPEPQSTGPSHRPLASSLDLPHRALVSQVQEPADF